MQQQKIQIKGGEKDVAKRRIYKLIGQSVSERFMSGYDRYRRKTGFPRYIRRGKD